MNSQYLKKAALPDQPGVYIFKDVRRRPLYIGRATSLKDRVKSYFSNDLIETRGPRIVDMATKAKSISFQKTDSVLEAVILESLLIKRYQPHYNVDDRDDKSDQYVIITDEAWPRVFLARVRDFDAHTVNKLFTDGRISYKIRKVFGPYTHGGLIKEALKILRKLFPFKDKKAHDPRHESFYRALGRSPEGNDTNAKRRYQRTISHLILFFQGMKNVLRTKLEKDMKTAIKRLEFEEAGRIKRLLYALDHVNDMALIKHDREVRPTGGPTYGNFRIEAYDVSHLSGTNVVGAMTVNVNGESTPSEYRKFKIFRQVNNDTAGLVEILSRRLNHSEWPYPDLIVVDGNEAQMHAAEAVLKARRISIPIVAVTKDARHKAADLIGNGGTAIDELIRKHKREIIAVNAEAHRFAIAFHRKKRRIF
jgi:excinuclease ABC subunit C